VLPHYVVNKDERISQLTFGHVYIAWTI